MSVEIWENEARPNGAGNTTRPLTQPLDLSEGGLAMDATPEYMASVRRRIGRNIVVQDDGCWIWQKYIDRAGYGRINIWYQTKSRPELAHRISYEVHVGPIGEGLSLDHLCRNRACVNPDHLEPCPLEENVRRSYPYRTDRSTTQLARTHCMSGHEYTDENTRYVGNGNERACRTCDRIRAAAYKAREKAKREAKPRVWGAETDALARIIARVDPEGTRGVNDLASLLIGAGVQIPTDKQEQA